MKITNKKRLNIYISACLLLITIAFSFNIQASENNVSLKSQATLSAMCNINIDNINYGSVTTTSNSIATTTLNILCTKNTPYSWEVLYSANDYANGQARMIGVEHGDSIAYAVFKSDGISSFNGNSSPSDYVHDVGTGLLQNYNIISKLLNHLNAPYVNPDNYVDTISISFNY